MGGGPRTLPGGLNKWQWKRMHEKKSKRERKTTPRAKKKKQLYQARIRFQIRTKLFTQSDPDSGPDQETPNHKPMSPDEHVKALADWFMKEGAEELWNEDDGPVKSEQRPKFSGGANQRPRSTGAPIDLKRLAADKRSLVNNSGNVVNSVNVNSSNYVKKRNHSVLSSGLSFTCNFVGNYGETVTKLKNGSDFGRTYFSGMDNRGFCRNESSLGESGSDYGRGDMVKSIARNLGKNCGNGNLRNVRGDAHKKALLGKRRFKRNESSSSDDDDSDFELEDADEKVEGWRDVKKMGSSASLGKYDVKIMKRMPLKSLEDEYNFSEQVELIRNEISKNRLVESEGKQEKSEEPILSQKRFDECGRSPLTFKAITVAVYVQMTSVQEATLSVCFDAMFPAALELTKHLK